MDGFTVTRRLRETGQHVPVLFLTARDDTADKVAGPHRRRRRLRHQAVQPRGGRRPHPRGAAPHRGARPDDDAARPALRRPRARRGLATRCAAAAVASTCPPPSSSCCATSCSTPGRVLSKSQILDHVWQYDWGGDGNIVESYISYLRRKIDAPSPTPTATAPARSSTPSAASGTCCACRRGRRDRLAGRPAGPTTVRARPPTRRRVAGSAAARTGAALAARPAGRDHRACCSRRAGPRRRHRATLLRPQPRRAGRRPAQRVRATPGRGRRAAPRRTAFGERRLDAAQRLLRRAARRRRAPTTRCSRPPTPPAPGRRACPTWTQSSRSRGRDGEPFTVVSDGRRARWRAVMLPAIVAGRATTSTGRGRPAAHRRRAAPLDQMRARPRPHRRSG